MRSQANVYYIILKIKWSFFNDLQQEVLIELQSLNNPTIFAPKFYILGTSKFMF
jgi:hypothetical protein